MIMDMEHVEKHAADVVEEAIVALYFEKDARLEDSDNEQRKSILEHVDKVKAKTLRRRVPGQEGRPRLNGNGRDFLNKARKAIAELRSAGQKVTQTTVGEKLYPDLTGKGHEPAKAVQYRLERYEFSWKKIKNYQ